MVVIGEALVIFWSRLDFDAIFGNHAVAEGFEQLQKIFEVSGFAVGNRLARDVVEVVFDEFADEVDDSLNLLSCCEGVVLAESEEVDYCFREDYFADLEVDLLVLQDLNLFDPAPDAYVLEDVDGDVDYG